jgi:hypothetical protein
LVATGHPDKFHSKPASSAPANFGQTYAERWSAVRHHEFHLQIGAWFYRLAAENLTAWDRDVTDYTLSDIGITGKNHRKIGEDSFAIAHFHALPSIVR